MTDQPNQTKDNTAWKIHKREERRARLKTLADSVNDTARMARGTLSLLLLVALYLGLTLLFSTDENLLLNGQVTLPQTDVGISIVQSYVFAPLIFFYLHIQTLFLLGVLARKVQTFEVALVGEFPDATSKDKQNQVESEREEYRDWLSAFAFVQLLRPNRKALNVARLLSWLGTNAVPLILLFAIDLSFIRYQSDTITWSHHLVVVLDLLIVFCFNCQVSGQSMLAMPRLLGTLAEVVLGLGIIFILILAARPPEFDPVTVKTDQQSIWRSGTEYTDVELIKEIKVYWMKVWSGDNLLDIGPCEWWRLACRYLDVNHKSLAKANQNKSDYVDEFDLRGRKLYFAKFISLQLQNAELHEAQLQGADLHKANLQGAELHGAQLQGANLQNAQLQGANLRDTQFRGANLRNAQLQGLDLSSAQLQGTDLSSAQLQGTDLRTAQLQGVDLSSAQLQGADLWRAQLQGAYLWNANFQGANIESAQLQGVNFGHTKLDPKSDRLPQLVQLIRGVFGINLQGANLGLAKLHGSIGKPGSSQNLVWRPEVSFNWPNDMPAERDQYLKKLIDDETAIIKLAWLQTKSLEEYMQELIPENADSPPPEDFNFTSLKDLPQSANIKPDWNKWAEWTAEFACENEHTARSSLQRWMAIEPLSGIYYHNAEQAEKTVYKALIEAREKQGNCPGLYTIPDDEWKKFVDG